LKLAATLGQGALFLAALAAAPEQQVKDPEYVADGGDDDGQENRPTQLLNVVGAFVVPSQEIVPSREIRQQGEARRGRRQLRHGHYRCTKMPAVVSEHGIRNVIRVAVNALPATGS
jgi:hypothetical protein